METIIVDDFLSIRNLDRIDRDSADANWRIQRSNPHTKEFLKCELSDNEFYTEYIFSKIKPHLDSDYKVSRVYFNGQWPGRHGSFHVDNCPRTALIYVRPYHPEWGGFTQIQKARTENDYDIIVPFENRLVIFDGNLQHKAYAFSDDAFPLRVSLAYKLV
tara:strand:- start:259 stop:738 length:480 start_codon:yes stop_codon:yes gene_type:complete